MNKDPMPLGDLPEYLKSLKEKGNSGPAPVVNMGQIKTQKKIPWLPLGGIVMMIALIIGGSMAYYDRTPSTQKFTIILNDNQDSAAIPTIVLDSGGELVQVKQQSNSVYEIEVATKKKSFLHWLRRNKNVKRADLKN